MIDRFIRDYNYKIDDSHATVLNYLSTKHNNYWWNQCYQNIQPKHHHLLKRINLIVDSQLKAYGAVGHKGYLIDNDDPEYRKLFILNRITEVYILPKLIIMSQLPKCITLYGTRRV